MGSLSVWEPLEAGIGRLARLFKLKKFMGEGLLGPAETARAKATMAAATEAFMLIVGLVGIGKAGKLKDCWNEEKYTLGSASECNASSKGSKEDEKAERLRKTVVGSMMSTDS